MLLLKKAYTIYIPLLMMKIKFTVIPALFFAVSIFLFPKKIMLSLLITEVLFQLPTMQLYTHMFHSLIWQMALL